MSKKSNPTLIGAFVIGALALLTLAVLLFGGSELLVKKTQVVSYFPRSVNGLRIGSNVTFRGVRIGYVKDIQLQADVNTLESLVQVTMELLPNQLVLTRKGRVLEEHEEPEDLTMQDVVNAGLKAMLDVESIVTGQLLVDLDFRPDSAPLYRSENPPYVEIPTIPSDIRQVLKSMQNFIADIHQSVDIKKLAKSVENILAGLEELSNSEDLRESLAGINRIVNDSETQELSASVQAALSDARRVLQDTRSLVNNADARIEPLTDELMTALNKLDSTLSAGEEALSSASSQMKGDTELAFELARTLDELQGTARALRIFLDYLERNPESLIRGKQP
jgi:paraquat-inducible protein B